MGAVLAATKWRTNADMIADAARLEFLRPEWLTLDPTYGSGKWWTKWRPERLVGTDILTGTPWDELPMQFPLNHFDAAVFDPPYVSIGGRDSSTLKAFNERYGLMEAPRTPDALLGMNQRGLRYLSLVVRPGGHILVKTMDYVSSGAMVLSTYRMTQYALMCGMEVLDIWQRIGSAGPQPLGRRQVHARHNASTLLILKNTSG